MKLIWMKVGVVAVVSYLSITIHLTFTLFSAIWLFNEHYDLLFIIHDHIGRTNSL